MSDANQSGYSQETGQALLDLARTSIAEQLGVSPEPALSPDVAARLKAPELQARRGAFVTLHKQGALRGCIGSLTSEEPLVENVKKNAVNAAFKDPRFPPLEVSELERIRIEISILSEPRPLSWSSPDELQASLDQSRPGVILKKGFAQATFLPQVWSQLPRAEDFLGQLCLKAGLPGEAWKSGEVDLLAYEVQSFQEP